MAKTINLTYEGTEYTLEFTRKSAETLEKRGFLLSDLADKPVTTLPVLFAGAFLAHHRFVKQEVVDAIFGRLTNRQELLMKLAEMYREPLETLLDDPDESEGNVSWGASW